MYIRYSTSLEAPLADNLGLGSFKSFLNDIILVIFSDGRGYKPPNCQKIKIIGRVFYQIKKSRAKKYPQPLEFEYVSNDEIALKQAIEQQISAILSKKMPKNCYKIKIKFIINFYYAEA